MYTAIGCFVFIIIMAITHIIIENRQYRADRFGLRQSDIVVIVNQLAFVGLMTVIGNLYWGLFSLTVLVVITVKLLTIRFNHAYNRVFGDIYCYNNLAKAIILTLYTTCAIF